jgi:hypothetical protein
MKGDLYITGFEYFSHQSSKNSKSVVIIFIGHKIGVNLHVGIEVFPVIAHQSHSNSQRDMKSRSTTCNFFCFREDGSSIVLLLVADPQIQGYQFEGKWTGPFARWDADR